MTRKKGLYNCNNSADDLNLSKAEKQSAGAFHTPKKLAMDMAKKLYPDYIKCKTKAEIIEKFGQEGIDFLKDFNLIDPCCGTGNLLAAAMNVYKWIDEEDLYGVDIDPRAVEFCIKKFPHGHFQVGDCLTENITDDKFWTNTSDGMFGDYQAKLLVKATQTLKDKNIKNRKEIAADLLKQKQLLWEKS